MIKNEKSRHEEHKAKLKKNATEIFNGRLNNLKKISELEDTTYESIVRRAQRKNNKKE